MSATDGGKAISPFRDILLPVLVLVVAGLILNIIGNPFTVWVGRVWPSIATEVSHLPLWVRGGVVALLASVWILWLVVRRKMGASDSRIINAREDKRSKLPGLTFSGNLTHERIEGQECERAGALKVLFDCYAEDTLTPVMPETIALKLGWTPSQQIQDLKVIPLLEDLRDFGLVEMKWALKSARINSAGRRFYEDPEANAKFHPHVSHQLVLAVLQIKSEASVSASQSRPEQTQRTIDPSSDISSETRPDPYAAVVSEDNQDYGQHFLIVSTVEPFWLRVSPVGFNATRIDRQGLLRVISSLQVNAGGLRVPDAVGQPLRNLADGIERFVGDGELREGFRLHFSGLLTLVRINPDDIRKMHDYSAPRTVGLLFVIKVITAMVRVAARLAQALQLADTEKLTVSISTGGLLGRTIVNDAPESISFNQAMSCAEQSHSFTIIASREELESDSTKIARAAIIELLWLLNQGGLDPSDIEHLQQDSVVLKQREHSLPASATENMQLKSITPFFLVKLSRAENERLRGEIKNAGGDVATNVRLTLPGLPQRDWGSLEKDGHEELAYFWDLVAEGYDGAALLEFTDRFGRKWEQRTTVESPLLRNKEAHDYKLEPFGPARRIDHYSPVSTNTFAEGDIPWFHVVFKLTREPTGLYAKGSLANIRSMQARSVRLDLPCLGRRRLGTFAGGEVREVAGLLNLPAPSAGASSGIGAIEYEDASHMYRQEACVEFPAVNDMRENYLVRQFCPPRIIDTYTIAE